ncbi:MAG TPA: ATP-binding cassette domain-containing protein [Candidatus Avamphibacillus sp.]|nr:ATP-binding cassette domain-containing protein [Candidatus Avamphibacillus sp.]
MFQIEKLFVKNVLKIKALKLHSSIISIEGQSGSGKSTLLRLLNHLDNPTSGNIYYKNQKLTDIEPMELRKKIVMVPQSPVVFDGTIRDNLNIGLEFSGEEPASDNQLKDMLQTLWLDKILETSASDLSGGEQQRMALGRVLLMEKAKVFLLDEPSSDLDDHTTDHVIGEFINRAREQEKQVIMVTHDKSVTDKFADQKINMDEYSLHLRNEARYDE